jgi:hypothetical protein
MMEPKAVSWGFLELEDVLRRIVPNDTPTVTVSDYCFHLSFGKYEELFVYFF